MNMNKEYHDYMSSVGGKITAALKDLKSSGNHNAKGLAFSAERIRKSAENLFHNFSNTRADPVKAIYKSFSETPGLSNVENVCGVDVVDINIQATINSVLGYLVAERGMDKPTDTLWLQGLKTLATGKGFKKGEWVTHPYKPTTRALREAIKGSVATAKKDDGYELTGTGTATDPYIVTFDKPVQPNTLQVVSNDKTVGRYIDGKVFLGADGEFEYRDGMINFQTTDPSAYTFVFGIDRSQEKDGASTLRVKPGTDTVQVTAESRRITLEENYEDNAYMNKQMFNLAESGVVMDYGKQAVNQLLQTFVEFLDFDACGTIAESISEFEPVETLDLTDYLLATSEANTKNDIVNQYVLKLNKALQQACKFGMTALLVDSEAAIVLGNNPAYFVANATFDGTLDGLIGTYRGIPVVRHHYLDGLFDTETETYGVVFALYKAPDNSLAAAVYGEYLAPFSVTPALNWENPSEFAQGLYSMSKCKAVADDMDVQLGTWMKILVSKTE